jgi:hypothetical protein
LLQSGGILKTSQQLFEGLQWRFKNISKSLKKQKLIEEKSYSDWPLSLDKISPVNGLREIFSKCFESLLMALEAF